MKLPQPPVYPFHHLLPSAAMSPPAVTALPADFRPLSLAAGHCGYCPVSFPPSPFLHLSQCPGRCTCIFTCTAATTHTPLPPLSPCLLPDSCFASVIVSCPWTFALCGVCWHVSSLCSLFFSPLSTSQSSPLHFQLLFYPAALYPFRHPHSPSYLSLKCCIFDSTFGQFLRDEKPL